MKTFCKSMVAAICVMGGSIQAQDRAASFGILAGAEQFAGTYASSFKTSAAVGGEGWFPLPGQRLSIRGDITYHLVRERDDVCELSSAGGCADQEKTGHFFSGSVDLVAHLNDPASRWSPYVLGGAAYYVLGNQSDLLNSFDPQQVGLQAGVGIDLHVGSGGILSIELRYLSMPPGSVVPLTVGLRF